MSDADLRELGRRWRETGSVEDEAAWLRARVQAGELEQSRLELAASLGSCPAAEAQSSALPVASLRVLLEQISSIGGRVLVRSLMAMGYAVLPVWKEEHPLSEEPVPLLSLTDAWLVGSAPDFCERTSARWEDATNLMLQSGGYASTRADRAYRLCLHAVSAAAWSCDGDTSPAECAIRKQECVSAYAEACVGPDSLLSEDSARAAIATELVPWLLGYSDPVRDRVEARQRAEAAGG